jgi:NAD(P)H dehydrogenase (quinone)
MKSLIVSSHPEHGSFNWGMADAARDALKSLGHQVKVLDLLEEDFDPVMRPAQFQTTSREARSCSARPTT